MINKDIIDELEELQMEGMPDIVIEMIDSYLNTTKARMDSISSFVNSKNIIGAAKEAHALKSGSQNLGALVVAELCQNIESHKETQNIDEVIKLTELLKIEYMKSCDELSAIKKSRTK